MAITVAGAQFFVGEGTEAVQGPAVMQGWGDAGSSGSRGDRGGTGSRNGRRQGCQRVWQQ